MNDNINSRYRQLEMPKSREIQWQLNKGNRRVDGRHEGAHRNVWPGLLAHAGDNRIQRNHDPGALSWSSTSCAVVPRTGLPTEASQGDVMQARWGTHGEHSIIALCPSSVEECFTLTVDAFNLAERFRAR